MENPQQLMQFLQQFEEMYSLVHVVDSLVKRVISIIGCSAEVTEDSICYKFWERSNHCANCVPVHAVNENDAFVKIEYNQDKISMVMVMPAILSSHTYIVEVLKDVSEIGVVPDLRGKSVEKINQVIENLNQVAITDKLTRVYNRRFISEKLSIDLYAIVLDGGVLSMILIDVDDFKQINGTYDHDMGDRVLQKVAKILQDNIQCKGDWVTRYGGDEFLVVLPDTNQKNTGKTAERI